MMVLGKHEQMEGLLGELSFATLERGTKKSMHHLNQRRGPYDGVELIAHQRFARRQLLFKETFGTRQPFIAFPVMVTRALGVRLGGNMRMVPRQYETSSGIGRNHCTELRSNRFCLCKRDSQVIAMRVHGLQRRGKGGAVQLFDHGENQRPFRANAFDGAQSPRRRA